MAGFEDLFGLGGFLEPPSRNVAGQGEDKRTWGDWLSDSVNRSALISFGLQAMTGGWGGGGQQLAQAIGAGFQGAAGTAQVLEDERLREEEREEKRLTRRETREDRESGRRTQLEVAKIGSASREEVARARIEGMLERTRLNLTAKTGDQLKQFNKDRDTFLSAAKQGLSSLKLSPEELAGQADAYAERLAARRGAFGGAATSGNLENGGGVGVPSGGGEAGKTTTETKQRKTWRELIEDPTFKAYLEDETKREYIKKKRPDLKPYIEAYEGVPLGGY